MEHFQFWGMYIQFPHPHAVLLKSAVLESLRDFQLYEGGSEGN